MMSENRVKNYSFLVIFFLLLLKLLYDVNSSVEDMLITAHARLWWLWFLSQVVLPQMVLLAAQYLNSDLSVPRLVASKV